MILSGLNVFSESMMMTSESNPPISSGSVALTASWKQTCVLQLPNSPKNSMMDWLSSPPARSSSNALDPVVSLVTLLRLSRMSSPVSKPPMSAQSLAPSMMSIAFFSPISHVSASSFGEATAMAIKSLYPASRSFSDMAGPTPGMSSRVFLTIGIPPSRASPRWYLTGSRGSVKVAESGFRPCARPPPRICCGGPAGWRGRTSP